MDIDINEFAAKSNADRKLDQFVEAFKQDLSQLSLKLAKKGSSDRLEVHHIEEAAIKIFYRSHIGPRLHALMID